MLRIFFKKWAFLVVILIFNLIIGIRLSISFFYFFFWFLLSVAVINLAWLAIQYFAVKLSFVRKAPHKIEEEETLEIEIAVKNNSPLPVFNIILEDYLDCASPEGKEKKMLLDYLSPRPPLNIFTVRYRCRCPQRGRYAIGPISVYFFDPWGIFFLKKAYFIYSELYVYPRTFAIARFPALTKGVLPWFGIETARASGDEDEFFGIREYREKDPIKIIHWLSTARKNRLIVKQFQRQSYYRATLIFTLDKDKNFGQGKDSVSEYIIRLAASVAKYLTERNVTLEIIAHATEMVHIPFNKGPGHLEDILRFLTLAQAESRVNLAEVFQEFSGRILNDSSLIAIMPDEDLEYLPVLLSLKNRNVSLLPLILVSSSFLHASDRHEKAKEAGQIKLPQSLNINPIFFSCGDDLAEAFVQS